MIAAEQNEPAVAPRVLLLVTTRRDAEITQRLLGGVGLIGEPCTSIASLREQVRGAAALLLTEERLQDEHLDELVGAINPSGGNDLPTVLLARGGSQSKSALRLVSRVRGLTVLERPTSVTTIVSAVKAAIRLWDRQKEMERQLETIGDLQKSLSFALAATELGTFHSTHPFDTFTLDERGQSQYGIATGASISRSDFYRHVHADDRELTREAFERCVSHHEKFQVEHRVVSPTGAVHWILAVGEIRRDPTGSLLFGGTIQDVTSRKHLEDERNQLLKSEQVARIESNHANRLKDEFLATLSHELRTPLNAIVGWVELMKYECEDPAAVREGLDVIERNVRAQSQLIDDLLDVSRIISGKVRLDVKSVQIGEVIGAALDTVRPTALTRGVRLESVVPPHLPEISGDVNRLQQVVWNLLTNAIKFTPKGGRVQVVLEQTDSTIAVSVTDTGEGIEKSFLPHVFERFRQADGSTTRRHGGLGLGLSIVKTLVEMHGGRVLVESDGKGHGTTFIVRLPIRIAKGVESEVPRSSSLDKTVPPFGERPDLSGLKVLVVDDEADARTMMLRLLRSCQASALEASSAEEAQILLRQEKPALLISDIGMPVIDGYQFIRSIRSQGIQLPAIALTAFARSEDRVRAIQAGFQAHLAKPIEPAELFTMVASLCGRIPPAPI